jgi:hypothetical protein
VSQWVAAHEELAELARRRSELDGLEGAALLRALRAGVHQHLGFASFAEYVERLFGYSRRTLDDKLRTAEALETLPELTRALRDGAVSWSAARELARVATIETEREWLDAARGRTVHEVERLVSGRARGARPGEPPSAAEQRHVLRLEVSPETFATFREALKVLRQKSNEPLDDDSALLLMARGILHGPTDAGRGNYQVALNICERCSSGFQQSAGELVEVNDEVVEMARCDAQYIGPIRSESTHVGTTGIRKPKRVGGEDYTHESTHVREPTRATQTIPPALRRKVMRRDRGRCVVPGCRHATFRGPAPPRNARRRRRTRREQPDRALFGASSGIAPRKALHHGEGRERARLLPKRRNEVRHDRDGESRGRLRACIPRASRHGLRRTGSV